jgi:acetyl-CoA C-acetyltransferase
MLRPPQGDEAIVVTHALRTPIGKYLGAFADLTAADLGAGLVAELLARSGVGGADVGEVIMGNGRQAGGGPNVSRQIAYRAGIAQETCAWTVNMACGSGLKSILLGAEAIALGRADIVVAGGVESMSGLPFFLPKFRTGYRLGHADVVDVQRWIWLSAGGHADGRDSGEARAGSVHPARRTGRVRLAQPTEGRRRDRRGEVQGRDRAGQGAGQEGRRRRRRRRARAPRHDA